MSFDPLVALAGVLPHPRVPPRAKRDFVSMLRVQLEAGFEPGSALRRLGGATAMAHMAQAMAAAIEEGATFTEAAARHPALFEPADLALLGIGEETGSLPAVLASLERTVLWLGELRSRTVGALIYPFILLNLSYLCFSIGTLMAGSVLAYVLGWVSLNLGLALALVAAVLAYRSQRGRWLVDAAVLAVPGPGVVLAKPVLCYHRALFFSALGRSLEVGQDLMRGLELATRAMPNQRVRADLATAAAMVERGDSLARGFAGCRYLTAAHKGSISAGEQSGQLPAVLDTLAEAERELLEHWTRQYTKLLPVALLLLMVFYIGSRVL
jgi:type II secretory pathway component PulF